MAKTHWEAQSGQWEVQERTIARAEQYFDPCTIKATLDDGMSMKLEGRVLEEAHILLHPIRFRIVELLAEGPKYVNELAKALGEERRLVSYHLLTLEAYGFVLSRYEISEDPKLRGKALRKYWVDGKREQVISELKNKL